MDASDTALAAIEARTRTQVAAAVDTINTTFGEHLANAVASDQAPGTGTELLSRDDVHQALTAALAASQTQTQDSTSAGYLAAAALAALLIAAALGEDPQKSTPTDYLTAVLADIAKAFAATFLVIHNGVRAGYDGASGPGARHARVLTTNAALRRAVRLLNNRAQAAAAVAVHRGYTDAQQAIYADWAARHTDQQLIKRWHVTSANPCPVCAALDGTTAALAGEFDRNATNDATARPLAVYRDLTGPPRHPNCRCRLTYEVTQR